MVSRTEQLLRGPVLWTLLRLATPNVLVMLAQAMTGLIETYFVARLGTDALAGMALVFPGVMLMQMISAGAMGGGISSAIARALGGGRRDEADALVLHGSSSTSRSASLFIGHHAAVRLPIYRAMGGSGGELQAALIYSNVVFAGNVLVWILNSLASVIRGTGNMLVPAMVICVGVVVLIPLSPCLIFGIGPFPALGIAGGALAFLLYNAAGTVVLGWYVLSGRNVARLRLAPLRWRLIGSILRVGAWSSISSVQTNVTIASATALVAGVGRRRCGRRLRHRSAPRISADPAGVRSRRAAGGDGRHQYRRGPVPARAAHRSAAAERSRSRSPRPLGLRPRYGRVPGLNCSAPIRRDRAGSDYLHAVGPFYGFFGLGLALYFASQGAGRVGWPLFAGFVRMAVAIGGGFIALRLTGSLSWLFVALAAGLALHGTIVLAAVLGGAWRRTTPQALTLALSRQKLGAASDGLESVRQLQAATADSSKPNCLCARKRVRISSSTRAIAV